MKHVELVQGHGIEQQLDVVDALEVARRIEHEAAPGKTRCIGDADRRHGNGAAGSGGEHLQQGHRAIEQAGRAGGTDADAFGGNLQLIAAFRDISQGRFELEVDAVRGVCLAYGRIEPQRRCLAQQLAELCGDGARGLIVAAENRVAVDGMASGSGMHLLRRGNDWQGERGGRLCCGRSGDAGAEDQATGQQAADGIARVQSGHGCSV
ncbi:hypothetical protein D3C81_814880 [compost metagenome]